MERSAQGYFFVCVCLFLQFMLLQSAASSAVPDGHLLNHALHHFDVLHSSRLKHRAVTSRGRELHLTTLGRDFKMLLFPRKQLFQQRVNIRVVTDGEERKHAIDFSRFFTGRLKDDFSSSITAHLDLQAGELTATILTTSEQYYIEPSHRHFQQSHDFHMISYRASDLKYNLTRDPLQHFCGNDEHHSTAANKQPRPSAHFEKIPKGNPRFQEDGRLLKRQVSTGHQVCPLHLVATHQFHERYSRDLIVDSTILFMVQVIDSIDQEIFMPTLWSAINQPTFTQLGFSIANITVYETPSSLPTYNRAMPWSSSALLEEFSHNDWGSVCLAHLFTAVTLTDQRLGVAYVANDDINTIGGICSEFIPNFNGFDTTTNVGVSSYLNEGRQLLLGEARLVTAHELGHNWGSEHDPTDSAGPCNPPLSPSEGKFLMFPSAQDGSQSNNDVFSPCSRGTVARVLRIKAACFTTRSPVQCGNYEVEPGEQCDGGFFGQLNRDSCCDENCNRRPNTDCSDVNDVCCSNCSFAPPTSVCRTFPRGNRDCRQSVNCNGENARCPVERVTFVAANESCGLGGECRPCLLSDNCATVDDLRCHGFCELVGLSDCFCPGENDCYFCCNQSTVAGGDNTCQVHESRTPLPAGSTCSGGRCDGAGNCEPTTQDLVNRLFDLFSDFTASSFARFLGENIVGAVVVLTLLAWVPGGILIHCLIDRKIWKTHKKTSEEIEKQKLLCDLQDAKDLQRHDQLATTPGVIDPHCKRGLLRADSLHGDFFDGDHFYLGTTPSPISSPTKGGALGAHRLSVITEERDPERDNILAHFSSSLPDSTQLGQP